MRQGGELFDRIIEENKMSEKHAAIIMRQMLRAINYMHGSNVMSADASPRQKILNLKVIKRKKEEHTADPSTQHELERSQTP